MTAALIVPPSPLRFIPSSQSMTASSPSQVAAGPSPIPDYTDAVKENRNTRGRRERPCDSCRKRKSKCVVNRSRDNSCAACGVHGRECTYLENPQTRKRRPDRDDKEPVKRRGTLSKSRSDTVLEQTPVLKYETEPSSPGLRNIDYAEIPQRTSAVIPQHYSTHGGHTTEYVHGATSYPRQDAHNGFLGREPGVSRYQDPSNAAYQDIEQLVDSHGPVLVETFKNTIHWNFPVVQDEFFQRYESGQMNDLDPTLLAAVYSVAVSYPILEASDTAIDPSDLNVLHLEDLAFRLFGESLCKPTLPTFQAGLLLIQNPNIDSSTLNTQLVGIGYELGLHLDCSSWKCSAEERGLRKRLAWALYMQDKWCSLIHGRPSAISKQNWAVKVLEREDYAAKDEVLDGNISLPDIERGRELFSQMIVLTEILSIILDTFYTLQAMQEIEDAGENGTALILERAKPVQIRLKEWYSRLPRTLKMDNSLTGKLSSTGYLHLAYFATEITLHRCIMRSLTASNADSYLFHICRSAAKTRLISSMDFVNRLKPQHLTSFWYFPSKVNFALVGTFGSLLLATAPSQEETDFYRTRLAEYRWTLCVSSKNAGFVTFAIDSLDSSLALLKDLPQKPPMSELRARLHAARPLQKSSPSNDELLVETSSSSRPWQLDSGGVVLPAGHSSMASGLVSPSTSTSSGSTTYNAYAETFGVA